jgi:cytochrome P450
VGLVRALLEYRKNALPTLEKMVVEYGDVTYFPLPGGGAFLLGNPELIAHVLIKNVDNYQKTSASKWARHFFGNAMQINNGDYARNLRKMLAPVFHGETLARAYSDIIVNETAGAVRAWPAGHRAGFTQELTDVVLDIVMRIFFGTEPGEETKRMGQMFLAALPPVGTVLPAWIPGSRNQRYIDAAAALNAEVMRRIELRRANPSEGCDFLTTLANVNREGHGLTDQQIRDELVAYALAGYSASTAVNQILRLIAENPRCEEEVGAEIASVIGDRNATMHDLPRLEFLGKVIKEALRLCPPAGMMFRRAVADDNIGGWPIPAGARMFVSSWVVQRDPRFFDEPLEFKPERWTPQFERSLPMCAYFPFGRGPRACIGGAMGELILQLMVATICARYKLEALSKLPSDQAEWPAVLANGGVQVAVHPRLL